MNGVGAGNERGANNVWDVEITFTACCRPDTDMFISLMYGERLAISFRVGDDAWDAHLATSADDSQGDFTTIGYQNFTKHRHTYGVHLLCRVATLPIEWFCLLYTSDAADE